MYIVIRHIRRLVLSTLVATLLPAVGNAQAIASNFQELRFRVEPGDTIYITDRSDRETAAEIVELSRSALTVRISGEPRALAEQDLRRIRQRLPDPLWTGALIGGGIGVGMGTAVASISDNSSADGGVACSAPVVAARPNVAPPGNWGQAAVGGRARLMFTFPTRSPSLGALQQPRPQQRRGWIGRHPVLFGTLVGFGGGFLIGYSRGDDGVFDDFTAEFNGLVLGGVGAGVGAVSGAILAR